MATERIHKLHSRTKLLEKVFPIMSTFLRNKTISKTTPLRKENPFPQFNVASHKRPGIRLSFEYTTTLLSGEGGEGRTGTATMFRKMLSKYTIFSTVLSKIVGAPKSYSQNFRETTPACCQSDYKTQKKKTQKRSRRRNKRDSPLKRSNSQASLNNTEIILSFAFLALALVKQAQYITTIPRQL